MLYDLCDLSVIKKILNKYGFRFNKSLGQNFIIDYDICPNIVSRCLTFGENAGIIEVGPGIGTLTQQLALKFKKVLCIEKDRRLFPILKDTLSNFKNIKIIENDALKADFKKLIKEEFLNFDKVIVCSNLPYYITSPFIMKILENGCNINGMVIMVQKEAADRICAPPGSKECGAISIAVRYYSSPEVLFQVKKESFTPVPKVNSSIIKISINKNYNSYINDKNKFFKVVRASFEKRRKKLINSLNMGLNLPKNYLEDVFDKIGISKLSRAEELNFEDFINLSNTIEL
ncbi:MAG: 16S rRNA (adenine(1518)-N(6)/adenine(1519)-N(6))-dimethyltransferase RsmA [Oscillospiraceae bacterium]|jgi:16S rRNA (adenine1518-N6/adenine1519-N6)-dimethyltransferase|nr:16S rRNA (adenine(1518)-N(6)/adenine(1519)-N(6))-dimethyltransferase RsmA [Oscillospiraceae bacterium]